MQTTDWATEAYDWFDQYHRMVSKLRLVPVTNHQKNGNNDNENDDNENENDEYDTIHHHNEKIRQSIYDHYLNHHHIIQQQENDDNNDDSCSYHSYYELSNETLHTKILNHPILKQQQQQQLQQQNDHPTNHYHHRDHSTDTEYTDHKNTHPFLHWRSTTFDLFEYERGWKPLLKQKNLYTSVTNTTTTIGSNTSTSTSLPHDHQEPSTTTTNHSHHDQQQQQRLLTLLRRNLLVPLEKKNHTTTTTTTSSSDSSSSDNLTLVSRQHWILLENIRWKLNYYHRPDVLQCIQQHYHNHDDDNNNSNTTNKHGLEKNAKEKEQQHDSTHFGSNNGVLLPNLLHVEKQEESYQDVVDVINQQDVGRYVMYRGTIPLDPGTILYECVPFVTAPYDCDPRSMTVCFHCSKSIVTTINEVNHYSNHNRNHSDGDGGGVFTSSRTTCTSTNTATTSYTKKLINPMRELTLQCSKCQVWSFCSIQCKRSYSKIHSWECSHILPLLDECTKIQMPLFKGLLVYRTALKLLYDPSITINHNNNNNNNTEHVHQQLFSRTTDNNNNKNNKLEQQAEGEIGTNNTVTNAVTTTNVVTDGTDHNEVEDDTVLGLQCHIADHIQNNPAYTKLATDMGQWIYDHCLVSIIQEKELQSQQQKEQSQQSQQQQVGGTTTIYHHNDHIKMMTPLFLRNLFFAININSIGIGSGSVGIFPNLASIFNHSCNENLTHSYDYLDQHHDHDDHNNDGDGGNSSPYVAKLRFRSNQIIYPNTECCISYVSNLQQCTKERNTILQQYKFFTCTCSRCFSTTEENRIEMIHQYQTCMEQLGHDNGKEEKKMNNDNDNSATTAADDGTTTTTNNNNHNNNMKNEKRIQIYQKLVHITNTLFPEYYVTKGWVYEELGRALLLRFVSTFSDISTATLTTRNGSNNEEIQEQQEDSIVIIPGGGSSTTSLYNTLQIETQEAFMKARHQYVICRGEDSELVQRIDQHLYELQCIIKTTETTTVTEGNEEPNDHNNNNNSMNGRTDTGTRTNATTRMATNVDVVRDSHNDDEKEEEDNDNSDLLFFNQGGWHLIVFEIKTYEACEKDEELVELAEQIHQYFLTKQQDQEQEDCEDSDNSNNNENKLFIRRWLPDGYRICDIGYGIRTIILACELNESILDREDFVEEIQEAFQDTIQNVDLIKAS